MEFTIEDISETELERRRAVYAPLADSVRELIDAVIRTEVPDELIDDARRRIADVVTDLRAAQIDGPYGNRFTPDGAGMPWGNAVIGVRNAIAPPLVTEKVGDGVRAEFTLGAAYEGPGGHVHGGVCAMILDHILGEGASVDGVPAYTGTITVRYLRPTPLGDLVCQSWVTERGGRKKIVRGTLSDADGITAEAEGIFIEPRQWSGAVPPGVVD
ncbi:PaaI family thioesterase [Gordonia sp. ABSL1-1]|uniref:PaaI family thioesterase n=1 Tax=Gordonia sp. ABSL1-1 TaxID=3053923 RepID=UPI002574242A|nr:PaaI family thioesterase [Gordonia sp. ABSL1-1]MDL9937843.1 PaaI family thioesterase [Gordonia sp. ABSL1-1]